MALVMTPIYTRVLDNNNTSTFNFNNIPQVYTDLKLVISSRSASGTTNITGTLRFNGDTGNNYSATRVNGTGSGSASTARFSPIASVYAFYSSNFDETSNTFANSEIYIPNYTGSNIKSILSDSVTENNATAANQVLTAGLWNSTAAITSISLGIFAGFYAQNSSFSLYGIIRSGA